MEEAGKEEYRLATEMGDIGKSKSPHITVIADRACAKRAYNVNYDSASGVACIIGHRTKVLGVRNKHCCVCARAE
ncbi:hypothetical protein FQR65_LT14565 [Abscondita terminalis]|nr:hypothetical protein FQR65_LT14565 [Abscondita terminalis]